MNKILNIIAVIFISLGIIACSVLIVGKAHHINQMNTDDIHALDSSNIDVLDRHKSEIEK